MPLGSSRDGRSRASLTSYRVQDNLVLKGRSAKEISREEAATFVPHSLENRISETRIRLSLENKPATYIKAKVTHDTVSTFCKILCPESNLQGENARFV